MAGAYRFNFLFLNSEIAVQEEKILTFFP